MEENFPHFFDDKTYCSLCSKRFKSLGKRARHLRQVHKINEVYRNHSSKMSNKRKASENVVFIDSSLVSLIPEKKTITDSQEFRKLKEKVSHLLQNGLSVEECIAKVDMDLYNSPFTWDDVFRAVDSSIVQINDDIKQLNQSREGLLPLLEIAQKLRRSALDSSNNEKVETGKKSSYIFSLFTGKN